MARVVVHRHRLQDWLQLLSDPFLAQRRRGRFFLYSSRRLRAFQPYERDASVASVT